MSTQPLPAQTHVKRWLERALELRHWTPAELARRAGVSASTIGRALKDQKFVMTTATLSKISAAAQLALPSEITGSVHGLAEPEAAPYVGPVDAGTAEADNLDRWTINGRHLELAGTLPGDLVLVDRTAAPRAGDVVQAQVYDNQGGAETVFRIYDPPYLVTRTADPDCQRKPLLVDGERVLIMGVVAKTVRLRRP